MNCSEISKSYNNLSTVFEANEYLNKHNTKQIFYELFEVIKKYNLENTVGVRLLHKHNDISSNEIMLEKSNFDEDGFALITQATTISEELTDESYVPNSWQLVNGRFIPMEFSHKKLLADSEMNPENYANFFYDFEEILSKFHQEKILSPAILASTYVMNYSDIDSIMIELSALDDRANILRYTKEYNNIDYIETFWSISDSDTTIKGCQRICPSVQNPPVHQGTFIHKSS